MRNIDSMLAFIYYIENINCGIKLNGICIALGTVCTVSDP